ncbi:hypothetical protein EQZ23_03545 [Sphingomonas sp. UV9]|uniref:hypothetical protein n=1 Tax=Sphingomonas sp. UV9 TaxID=1851410 RepID=UPI000FFB0EAD|nr:hypothetical protein [Sphingomonas sp. UV9]RXD07160.1 hypothetical protein EQZ23_03545 [Sphingomonas sp. UV9]
MARPEPLPSLSSSLLARKGTARPAMRQPDLDDQAPTDALDDLGWNDMGGSQPQVLVDRDALKVEIERPVASVSKATAARIGRETLSKTGGAKAAFTLRLDTDRHLRLRLASAVTGRSSQQLVTQALDAFLHTVPEVDALVAQLPPATSKR